MNAATPWVLLRGLTRDARHWAGLPGRLRAAYPDAPIRCVDLAGNGTRWRERSAHRIEANVDDVERASEDLPRPLRVLAISLGAMVALEWSRRRPQDVAALVLVNTSLAGFNPWYRRFNPVQLPALASAFARRDLVGRERAVLQATSNRAESLDCVGQWSTWAEETPVSVANALRQVRAAAGYRIAGKPDVPILLLASRGDRLVDVRCSRSIAAAWSCPLREHPDAGHDLPLDDPDWILAQVGEWSP